MISLPFANVGTPPTTTNGAERETVSEADRNAGGEKTARLGYRPALDGLRGVAVLCVLGINCGLPYLKGGFIGVDIFFVLSGFLITTLLAEEWERTGKISLKRFYLRRGLRLLPALLVLLAVSCLYAAFIQSPETARNTYREALWVLGYLANWMLANEHAVGSLDHTWSLSVEEQFYFLWPLVLCGLLSRRIGRARVVFLIASLAAASAAWRMILWQNGAHPLRLYFGSDTRADALLIGCLLGLLFNRRALPATDQSARPQSRFRTSVSSLFSSLILVLFSRTRTTTNSPQRFIEHTLSSRVWPLAGFFLAWIAFCVPHEAAFLFQGGFTLIALAAAIILAEAVAVPQGGMARFLSGSLLVWVGRISYSLYVWHYPVFQVLRAERFAPWGWNPVVIHGFRFAAVFGVACLSYYLVERPFLSLKKSFTDEAATS